jgi:hypothetical protein
MKYEKQYATFSAAECRKKLKCKNASQCKENKISLQLISASRMQKQKTGLNTNAVNPH